MCATDGWARRVLIPSADVRNEGSGEVPAGSRPCTPFEHARVPLGGKCRSAISDHLTLGARPAEPMGFSPALLGRQFHRKRCAYQEQPVGGRHQQRYLQCRHELQISEPRGLFNHHFAHHGGSPRGIRQADLDQQRMIKTVDGYLTEDHVLRPHRHVRPPQPSTPRRAAQIHGADWRGALETPRTQPRTLPRSRTHSALARAGPAWSPAPPWDDNLWEAGRSQAHAMLVA